MLEIKLARGEEVKEVDPEAAVKIGAEGLKDIRRGVEEI